jgi:hypothetical protein
MNITVTDCDLCPMSNNDIENGSSCKHPNAPDDNNLDYTYRPPAWCPLRTESITIVLKEGREPLNQ